MTRVLGVGSRPRALALAVLLSCGGCIAKPALVSQSFSIDPPPPAAGPAAPGGRVLWLGRVVVAPPYAGTEFTYRTGEHGIERDAYARFAAPPGSLLTAAIRGYLLASGFVRDVEQPGGDLAADAILEVQATELCAELGGTADPAAVLTLQIRVLGPAAGTAPARELLRKTYAQRARLSQRTPAALAEGWNRALADIMKEFLVDLQAALPAQRSTQR